MGPADPLWLLAELLSALARAWRTQRERATRKRLLPPGAITGLERNQTFAAHRDGIGFGPAGHEPATLTDPIYARVQAAMLQFALRRSAARGASTSSVSWVVDGRTVTAHESGRPMFRAVWSALQGGWRLYWSRTPDRWWPYAPMTHLAYNSFESCVQEVERDPRGCFSGTFVSALSGAGELSRVARDLAAAAR